MSAEFSRRADVQIIKDEPLDPNEWASQNSCTCPIGGPFVEMCPRHFETGTDGTAEYSEYVARFQPYRWRAVAANNEPIAHGESYFNEADCINAVDLLLGDDTTVYRMPMYGEDRGEVLLRYGKTDRDSQAGN
jgi:uncharacterized protein YegP (UPF0339 family)